MTRYVLEGTWTGYTMGQSRVVHREVIDTRHTSSKYIESLRRLHMITYTDNTSLILSLREARPREKVKRIASYSSLIQEAVASGKRHFFVGDPH